MNLGAALKGPRHPSLLQTDNCRDLPPPLCCLWLLSWPSFIHSLVSFYFILLLPFAFSPLVGLSCPSPSHLLLLLLLLSLLLPVTRHDAQVYHTAQGTDPSLPLETQNP